MEVNIYKIIVIISNKVSVNKSYNTVLWSCDLLSYSNYISKEIEQSYLIKETNLSAIMVSKRFSSSGGPPVGAW